MSRQNFDVLTPYDTFDFPFVAFHDDDSLFCVFSLRSSGPKVAQIVPSSVNKYIMVYCHRVSVDRDPPGDTCKEMVEWIRAGGKIVFHPRMSGVEVVGSGCGQARFLVGAGISLFIVEEQGVVPDGLQAGGVAIKRMTLIYSCSVPGPPGQPLVGHLVPSEYLCDPPPVNLPSGLPSMELGYVLAPPPVFFPGAEFEGLPGIRHARVRLQLSEHKLASGGHSAPYGLVHGRYYLSLHGLPLWNTPGFGGLPVWF